MSRPARSPLAWIPTVTLVGFLSGLGPSHACDDELVVASAEPSGHSVLATVVNTSQSSLKGYLVLRVTMGSRTETVSVPVVIPAGESLPTTTEFAEEVDVAHGDACVYDPGGNTESPDPIIVTKSEEESTEE